MSGDIDIAAAQHELQTEGFTVIPNVLDADYGMTDYGMTDDPSCDIAQPGDDTAGVME